MKKELILAIAIGFGIGLIITGGFWVANDSLKKATMPTAENQPTPTLSTMPSNPSITGAPNNPATSTTARAEGPLTLSITYPEDEALFTTDKIKVNGKTNRQATITAIFDEEETISQTDANGNFSLDTTLVGGYNTITIVAHDIKGQEASHTLTVIYTTAKL